MLRIVSIERGPAATQASDSVRIDHDRRSRRRIVLCTEGGRSLLLDLARPAALMDGDVLVADDGSRVRVEAQAEDLLEILAPSAAELVRIAWHLGNRHLPTQFIAGPTGGTMRIRVDHVIAEMVLGLGGSCAHISASFDPEGGAYSQPRAQSGHHHHNHDADGQGDRAGLAEVRRAHGHPHHDYG